jgi:hypothetical protein
VNGAVRTVLDDLDVVELLADEPELLAIADAVVATQPRPPRRRLWPRLVALAGALVITGVVIAALPESAGDRALLSEALAAIGTGPVVHARIEARLPRTNVVDLATGRAKPQTVAMEYWYDEPRKRLRTVVRRGGVVVDELLQTRTGTTFRGRTVLTRPGVRPELDAALAGFVTHYRAALETGRARILEEAELDGRPVVWVLLSSGATREEVAVDAETSAPVLIRPVAAGDSPGALSWRVRTIDAVARVEGDFARPAAQPRPFRGDVRASRPLSSSQVPSAVAWPALWLGESWGALRLVSLELQTLTRGYPPESGAEPTRGEGLRLRYAIGGEPAYVEVSQAPAAEPAYAFVGGEVTFGGNPIPPEGEIEIVDVPDGSGRGAIVVGQLRRDGVFVTIWASSRRLCLDAARALRRTPT